MPGEAVIQQTRLHWSVYVVALIILAVGVGILLGTQWAPPESRSAIGPIGLGVLVLGLILFLAAYVRRGASEFAVTNKRVIVKTGWIRRHSVEILLRQVEGITVDQDLLGRIFGFGTITVEGTGSDRTPYRYIARPMQFRLAVQEQIEHVLTPAPIPASPGAAGSKGDRYDELLRLNELKAKGILTEEEFLAEKQRVLGRDPAA